MLDLLGNGRPAGDLLSRVVRITLGGTEYVLPVRSIKANREWIALVNGQTVGMLKGLEGSGDDLGAMLRILGGQIDPLIDLLLAYDTTAVLPTREAIEDMEPDASLDVLEAVQGVWRAANPLVGTALGAMTTGEAAENGSSQPTSSPPPSTAGRRKRSKSN